MTATNNKSEGFRLPILQGVLPIKTSQIPTELIAGYRQINLSVRAKSEPAYQATALLHSSNTLILRSR
jgi:hypothetical protein